MFVSFVIFWSLYHLLLQVNVSYKQLKGRDPQYKRKVSFFSFFFFFRFFPLLSCLCPHVKSPSYWDSKQVKSNIFGPFFLSNVCVGSITNSAIISRSRNSPTPPPFQRPSSLIIPKILLTSMQHEISFFHLRPLEILFFSFYFFSFFF